MENCSKNARINVVSKLINPNIEQFHIQKPKLFEFVKYISKKHFKIQFMLIETNQPFLSTMPIERSILLMTQIKNTFNLKKRKQN